MPWTNINKPSASTWTDSHPQGKQQYDESTITYDDASVYYDGLNPLQWTDVAKPIGYVTLRAGMATGLLMPLTYATGMVTDDPWMKVAKPT